MRKIIFFIALVLALSILQNIVSVYADSTPEPLQRIIITPNRFSQKFKNSTGEISIIDKNNINNSGAQVLLDVFRTIKGVLVTDYYGNGARATVDLRGFGETSSSNALVLVDGRRVNAPDLSGVDWMQIPLERIERIEVLHGGTGSVIYGDNAVGGVINIITKSGKTAQPNFELYSAGGSYNMNKESISCEGNKEKLSYSVSTTHLDTNGYRENGEYRSSDFGAKFKYQINDALALKISGNYHDADLGLAGSLTSFQYAKESRRSSPSNQENNNAGEEDYYLAFGLEGLTFDIGILDLDFSLRRRNSSTYYPAWVLIMRSKMDIIGFTPNYTCTLDFLGRPNKIIAGIDFYKTDNKIDYFNYTSYAKNNDNDIDKDSLGFYISDSFSLTDKLSVDFGFRHEKITHVLNYIDLNTPANNVASQQKRKEEAFKGGLVYSPNENTQLFFNASKSFRSPLTDEFLYIDATWQNQINTGLSTQKSLGFDWGARHAFNEFIRVDLTFFNMDVDNEIFYNPDTQINDNYSKTRHQGIDMQIDFKLTERISAFANWIYTRARFRKDSYGKNTIPMVPLNKASAGLNLGFWDNFKVIPMINYVGRKFAISDQANAQGKIDSYFTLDLRTSYERDNFELFFNVNNIFNKRYAEYAAYSSWTGDTGYYPAPERNFAAGVKVKF